MKKIYIFIVVLLITNKINAQTFTIDGINYKVIQGTNNVKINLNSCFFGDLILNETLVYNSNTYALTDIGPSAFSNCADITSVMIPNSVVSIGDNAFEFCTSLSDVDIADSVINIGSQAFSGCSSLINVSLSNSLLNTGNSAFRDCTALTNITLPESLTTIDAGTFLFCNNLTSIEIPDSVIEIYNSAFHFCSSLSGVTFGNSLTSIYPRAFSNCALTDINIPDSVIEIGNYAFAENPGLDSVTVNWDTPLGMSNSLNAFQNSGALVYVPSNIDLLVPENLVPSYSMADVWQEFNVLEQTTLSIEDQNFLDFKLNTNPIKDFLTISINKSVELKQIKIYDYSGKLIEITFSNKINMVNYNAGVYFLAIETNKGKVSKKVIKN